MKKILLLVLRAASTYCLLANQNRFHSVVPTRQLNHRYIKKLSFVLMLFTLTGTLLAQTGSLSANGGRFVGFNIDGDTKTGHNKISPAGAYMYDDDWFKTLGVYSPNPALGKGIFDVSDSATLRAKLQATPNSSFTKRMAGYPYDISVFVKSYSPWDLDTNFLVDGVYFRDYFGSDKSAFTNACKNGQSPNLWQGGTSSVNDKGDIIDVYTHVRTSGLNPAKDSAWFFAGVSTVGTNGSRYFDIEVYREKIAFTPSATGTGVNFVSQGTNYGHSKWELNSSGKVTRTGDIIISVSYSGGAPEIDFRIWIAKSTYDSIRANKLTPQTFKLNGAWDVADDNLHGYAEITGEVAGEVWGSGLGNYTASGNANSDTTYSTPWGTINTSGVWSQNYDQLQFVEVGLNFSRFGMNPFQYVTSYCTSPYSSILVKSRASTAFNAALIDFVGPIDFTIKEAAPYTVAADTITCSQPIAQIPFRFSARNYYRLLNSAGDTLAKDVDFRTAQSVADLYLPVSQPGTYRIEATNFMGCPTLTSTTVTIPADNERPTATPFLGHGQPFYFLNGEAASSNTNFGANSYTYSWTGPSGFTATTEEDPRIGNTKAEVISGNYYLTTTNTRNGCTSTAAMIYVDATTLPLTGITLQGRIMDGKVRLDWNPLDFTQPTLFEIERSVNGSSYTKIGLIMGSAGPKLYSFTDISPISGNLTYRIKSRSVNNTATVFSNAIPLQFSNVEKTIITRQSLTNSINIQLKKSVEQDVQVKVMTLDGRLLTSSVNTAANQNRNLNMPTSFNVALPANVANLPVIVALYEGSRLLEAKKL